MSSRYLSIKEMAELIVDAYKTDPKQNIGFLGTPGIGKTEGIYGAAEILKETYPDFFCRVQILSQMDAVDFRVPWVNKDGIFRSIPNEDFRFAPNARGFMFWDEARNANADVIKSGQQVLSDRRLGEVPIPDGVMILLASNNKSDRAGANSMLTAFSNRVEWHNVKPDYEDWINEMTKRGVDISLTSFIKKFPDSLDQFQPDKDVNPTPRTWFKCNKVLNSKYEYDRICGLVGEELATKFMAWRKLWNEFPEKEDVEKDPEHAKLPKDNDAQFALTCALSSWVNKNNWSNFYIYISRLNLEYQMLFMKESTRLHPKEQLKDTKEYSDWICKHQKTLI
jgi:hypothetical protein